MTETRLGNGISTTACEDLDTTARLTILIQCPLANDGGCLCSENCSRPLRHEGCLIWNKPMRDRNVHPRIALPHFQGERWVAHPPVVPVESELREKRWGETSYWRLTNKSRNVAGSPLPPGRSPEESGEPPATMSAVGSQDAKLEITPSEYLVIVPEDVALAERLTCKHHRTNIAVHVALDKSLYLAIRISPVSKNQAAETILLLFDSETESTAQFFPHELWLHASAVDVE
ncbi:hypothetical protein SISNIDRAFT_492574 [Sistotremastrum niveocremeum HHB9708]|uniref:Uncharacterized protein n=1 Tax=Sistotremastrum niveocremeum HHB9708 TaxID=1314777 RepID=A0A164ZX39_9AGAM|nr:hypothetical protein SISNIDRAFT_492574 [Sistotremastrum niveocremeum HHB9708]